MASKEHQLLEQIFNGKISWGPTDTSENAREYFDQVQCPELIETLDLLVANDFIGDYTTHEESHSGKRRIDRVHITKGLTFKGQDKSEWPD